MTTPILNEKSVREYGGNVEAKLVTVHIHVMLALALTPNRDRPEVDISNTGPDKQYRERDKQWYSPGHGIVLMYIAIGWLSSLTYTIS